MAVGDHLVEAIPGTIAGEDSVDAEYVGVQVEE
jgi:hypothetical protein